MELRRLQASIGGIGCIFEAWQTQKCIISNVPISLPVLPIPTVDLLGERLNGPYESPYVDAAADVISDPVPAVALDFDRRARPLWFLFSGRYKARMTILHSSANASTVQ